MPNTFHAEVKIPSMNGRGPAGGGANRFAPGPKPQNAGATVRRIVKIYLRWGKALFFSICLILISSGITVAIPYFIGLAFNTFGAAVPQEGLRLFTELLLIIAALYLCSWLTSTLNGIIQLRVSQQLVFTLRSEFFDKMQKLPLSFYDTTPHGDTMSRLTNDMDQVSSSIAQSTTQLITSALTLFGSLAVMLLLNPPLTLAVLFCVPLVAMLTLAITRKSRKFFLAQQRSLGDVNSQIEESILGLKMVKAFGRQSAVMERFDETNERLCQSSTNAQIWAGFMMPLMNVINNLTFASVAVVGGVMSVTGGVSVGTVVSFLNYSKQFSQPLNAVAGMFNTIQAALAGAERVFEIFDKPAETPDEPNAQTLENPSGRVEFRDVCFSYSDGRPMLKHMSFMAEPGETVALVGETGAGKTTIVNLLTRFYDPNSGSILIDGVDIRHITRASLRACFSVVLQDTCLFTGTIRENIRYSRPTAADAEVEAAAKLARAHPFIQRLPQGYDTMVSGSTDTLSEGQRQLLAIARAALCESPILILDEATSSVDTKTEKNIQRALLHLMENRTSFLIAHRLSTIRDADHIIVVGDGQILESGNHENLMAAKGAYYQMVVSQLGTAGDA